MSHSPIAHYRLGLWLLESGRPADALRHNLDALQSRADFVEAMHAATLALLELGQWRRARTMVDRAITTKSSPELLALRARLWRFRVRNTSTVATSSYTLGDSLLFF
jgi:hypothetical protein